MKENKNIAKSDIEKEKNLLRLFNSYDARGSKFITDTFLQRVINRPHWDENVEYKIECIKKFTSIIQSKIDTKYAKILGTKFNLSNNLHLYAHANMPKVRVGMEITQRGKSDITPASLNIPLDRLVKMPALEVYALMSAAVHSAVNASMNDRYNNFTNVDVEQIKPSEVQEEKNKVEDKIANNNYKQKATEKLTAYLQEFLPQVAGGEFKAFDDIAKVVAADIISGLDEEEYSKMLSSFFFMSKFDMQATEKVAEFLGKEVCDLETRTGKLYKEAERLWLDPDKEIEALTATQQYQELMSVKLNGQFAEIVKNNKNGNLQDSIDLRKFAQNYVATLMAANNLKPVNVAFVYNDSSSALGNYLDKGNNGALIEVNLSKISSISELITTLSHETTHAIESSINKTKGQKTEDGFGLDQNISNNISATTLSSVPENAAPEKIELRRKAYDELKKINKYCYRINPHERNARYGEMVGLKFLSEGCKINDPNELANLNSIVHKMEAFQGETLSILKMIKNDKSFAELCTTIDEIVKNSDAYGLSAIDINLFTERMDYIKKMRDKLPKSFDNSMEEESLKDIRRFIQKQEQKTEIAEMTNDDIMKELDQQQL